MYFQFPENGSVYSMLQEYTKWQQLLQGILN